MAKKGDKNKKRLRRQRAMRKASQAEGGENRFQLMSYEVTYEPIEDTSTPEEINDELESIYNQIPKTPKETIEKLKVLIEKYPQVPKLYNFICAAYTHLGNEEKSKYYAEINYQVNSHYLFAKLNYAEICLGEGNYELVPEILEHKFDIQALYPDRNVFHITEAVGFFGVVGWYYAHIDNAKQVDVRLKLLKKLAPDHPYTARLEEYSLRKTLAKRLRKLLPKNREKQREKQSDEVS